jgi:hypothetical protein
MPKMKWDVDGKGVAPGSAGGYAGPDLPKGSWPAKVKRVEVVKIGENKKEGDAKSANDGKPRLRILLEVQTSHDPDRKKYHGHPIWDGLNIIKGSESFVNGFLHGLTDGSQRAKDAIESAFWDDDKGPDIKRIKVLKGKNAGKIETHIIKIGRVKIDSPKGEVMVQVTTKPGEWKGDYRAEVTGYIPFDPTTFAGPLNGAEVDEDEDDDDLLDSDDIDEDDVDEDDDDVVDDDDDDEDYEDEDEDGEDAEDVAPASKRPVF